MTMGGAEVDMQRATVEGMARTVDRHVADRLRARRKAMGLSQKMLARRVGLSYQQIQKYERAMNRIGAGRLFSLAQALGVEPEYFYQGIFRPGREKRLIQALGGDGDDLSPAVRQAILKLIDSLAKV